MMRQERWRYISELLLSAMMRLDEIEDGVGLDSEELVEVLEDTISDARRAIINLQAWVEEKS